jgi:NAD(P)-dependent dehydrogenase (short-subunit alcohol dehydrogenase family)
MLIRPYMREVLWSTLFVTPRRSEADFSGQSGIVTGVNSGIGLKAARRFSELGCSLLFLAVRTISMDEAAKAFILQSTHRTNEFMQLWLIYMSHTASVVAFAETARSLNRVDVFVARPVS